MSPRTRGASRSAQPASLKDFQSVVSFARGVFSGRQRRAPTNYVCCHGAEATHRVVRPRDQGFHGEGLREGGLVPEEHLPKKVYEWLRPTVIITCQGTIQQVVLGSMAALTNGAAAQIRNQKPSPLMAAVFQSGEAHKGKSRLVQVLEENFEACDDVVAERVQALLAAASEDASISQVTPQTAPQPVVVKSITLQSFTQWS